jgi:hypothetical protein
MESTIKTKVKDGVRIIYMDDKIHQLRASIWRTIFNEKGTLSDCDIVMALGIVQYELVHHIKE